VCVVITFYQHLRVRYSLFDQLAYLFGLHHSTWLVGKAGSVSNAWRHLPWMPSCIIDIPCKYPA
jgi:hypothetical protein